MVYEYEQKTYPKFVVTVGDLLYIKIEDLASIEYICLENHDRQSYTDLTPYIKFETDDPLNLPDPFHDSGITKKPLKVTTLELANAEDPEDD